MPEIKLLTISNEKTKITHIRYNPEYSVICSIGKAPFSGSILIEYDPKEKLLEFESFEAWLQSIAMNEYSIESFCRDVFDRLTEVLGDDISLRVTVHAKTIRHGNAEAVICSDDWQVWNE